MSPAAQVLTDFGVNCSVSVVSAHRTPERMVEFARNAHLHGIKVRPFIASSCLLVPPCGLLLPPRAPLWPPAASCCPLFLPLASSCLLLASLATCCPLLPPLACSCLLWPPLASCGLLWPPVASSCPLLSPQPAGWLSAGHHRRRWRRGALAGHGGGSDAPPSERRALVLAWSPDGGRVPCRSSSPAPAARRTCRAWWRQ